MPTEATPQTPQFRALGPFEQAPAQSSNRFQTVMDDGFLLLPSPVDDAQTFGFTANSSKVGDLRTRLSVELEDSKLKVCNASGVAISDAVRLDDLMVHSRPPHYVAFKLKRSNGEISEYRFRSMEERLSKALDVDGSWLARRIYVLEAEKRERERELASLTNRKRELDSRAEALYQRRATAVGGALVSGYLALLAGVYAPNGPGWDVVEPITYFIFVGGVVAGSAFAAYERGADFSYGNIERSVVSRGRRRCYDDNGFDLDRYRALQNVVSDAEERLEELYERRERARV